MQFTEEILEVISKMLNIPRVELKYEKIEEFGGYYFKSSKKGRICANMLIDKEGNYKMIFSRNQKYCIEQFKKGNRDGHFEIKRITDDENNIISRDYEKIVDNKYSGISGIISINNIC